MVPDKKLKGTTGIYRIRNNINGKCYVGRAKCLFSRSRQYVYAFNLRNLDHINQYLLNSMIKYGFHNFTFEVIEICELEKTPERELHWILFHKVNEKQFGYNFRLDIDGHMRADQRTRDKISCNLKRQWADGKRSHHSSKLKKSWNNRDRQVQSNLMSKNLTKYKYLIDNKIECNYHNLKILGLANVQAKFHRYKTNIAFFKGVRIERIPA